MNKQSAVSVDVNLSKPVTVLVEKIANAIGVMYEPTRIKKKATAEAEAKVILVKAQIKASAIERRAAQRLMYEEAKKQANIEAIVDRALPQIEQSATPEKMDDDWVTNFFERSRNISDQEMQDVWSRLLAGEANRPGSYSKRTVNLLAELDKSDAVLFTKLAGFTLAIKDGGIYPYIHNEQDEIYAEKGISFANLQHLDSLGLIQFNHLTAFKTFRANQKGGAFLAIYHDKALFVTVPSDKSTELALGRALYTQQGLELYKICSPHSVDAFTQYFADIVTKSGLNVREVAIRS